MGIFDYIYNFFYGWLFTSTSVLSVNDSHIACVFMSVLVVLFVLYVAIMPIKAIISAIFRGF